ncbi:MAG: HNH endonuclease [Erythrobacter sp.]|nr:HNH endonuclease [Erythrobacter sp.]
MKKLALLTSPPSHLDRYIGIRDAKQRPTRDVLTNNHAAIAARYQALDNCVGAGQIEHIGASPLQNISDQLRHCYGSQTKRLLGLKKQIKKAQAKEALKFCPYCGTTTNTTHDHYLPATDFPEFAVHALNLVPCCSLCNTIKGDRWIDQAGQRIFINFYLDDIPDALYLHVDLITRPGFDTVGARFRIEEGELELEEWELIRHHYDRLGLIERYDDNANDEIAGMLRDAATHVEAGGPDARRFLARQAAKSCNVFGQNNWRAVLLAALADHAELEAWIDAG